MKVNIPIKKPVKRNEDEEKLKELVSKINRGVCIFGGILVLTGGIVLTSIAINDSNFDHTKELCTLTKMFNSPEHQIIKINNTNNGLEAIYNEEKTYNDVNIKASDEEILLINIKDAEVVKRLSLKKLF